MGLGLTDSRMWIIPHVVDREPHECWSCGVSCVRIPTISRRLSHRTGRRRVLRCRSIARSFRARCCDSSRGIRRRSCLSRCLIQCGILGELYSVDQYSELLSSLSSENLELQTYGKFIPSHKQEEPRIKRQERSMEHKPWCSRRLRD